MNFNDFRTSTYLTQRDVNNLSRKERRVIVDHVDAEHVGEDKKLKLVTYFANLDKGLVTNITNGEILADIGGSTDTDEWHGVHCEIYVNSDIGYGGKRTGGIRLRRLPTKNKRQSVEENDEDFNDEIPVG